MSSSMHTAVPDSSDPVVSPGSAGWLPALRTVAGLTLLSRVLGMLRDVATAGLFGLGPVMDAFVVAFRIPNLLRRFFGEGALAVSFLPVFGRRRHEEGPASAWALGSTLLAVLVRNLSLLVLAGMAACYLVWFVAGGHQQTDLLLGLTAVLLPFTIFVCVAAQLGAMLQTLDRFALPALAPALLNVCWLLIVGVAAPALSDNPDVQVYLLAAGLVMAMALQTALLYGALHREGFRFRPAYEVSREALGEVYRGLVPMLLGLGVVQINSFADSWLAWLLAQPKGGKASFSLFGLTVPYPLQSGGAASLYFAERLYQFPLGVFGAALATVIYPLLTRHAAQAAHDALRRDLVKGLQLVLAIGIPAGLGLAALAGPTVDAIFRHGSFTAADSARSAQVVAAYAVGVWAYCALLVLVRAFYAVGDHHTPVRVGAVAVGLNLPLGVLLLWPLGEAGLALATSVSATLQVVLLTRRLPPQLGGLSWYTLMGTAARVVLASAGMLAVVITVLAWMPQSSALGGRLLRLAVPLLLGLASYAVLAWVLGLRTVLSMLTAVSESRD